MYPVFSFLSAVVCNMFYKLETFNYKKEKNPTHVLFTCVLKFPVQVNHVLPFF